MNIYGEPKPIEPEETPIAPVLSSVLPVNMQQERERILAEISQTQSSSTSGKAKKNALTQLQSKLNSLDDNTKTY
jgi:hypothetical protein